MNSYQTIATVISSSLQSDWTKAVVHARVLDDFAETTYEYVDEAGKSSWFEPTSLADSARVGDAFIDLRQMMKQDGKEPWSRAVFTLTPDGKFNLEVSYGD